MLQGKKGFTLIELLIAVLIVFMVGFGAWTTIGNAMGTSPAATPVSASGVKKVTPAVNVQANGLTVEQNNIARRTALENKPGAFKHLYVISAYSGQCLIYSTVDGKVTSSGKRLSPYSVAASPNQYNGDYGRAFDGMQVNIGGATKITTEVLQDDGTYGSSIPYLYWFDVHGRYHQHYVEGGQIVHVSDEPIPMKNIIMNFEAVTPTRDEPAPNGLKVVQ